MVLLLSFWGNGVQYHSRLFFELRENTIDILSFASPKGKSFVGFCELGLCFSSVFVSVPCLICLLLYTSSTAQGGGGSFKNRKPIGEVGCCESGMA